MEPIDADYLFEARVPLEAPIDSGNSPNGQRMVFVVKEGTVKGPKVNGKIIAGSGADWARLRSDGSGDLDVRMNIQTDDGAILYVHWHGVMLASDENLAYALDFDKPDDPAGAARYYFRTSPRFETGDERYAWLNNLVCISKSRTGDGGVIHEVYAVR